MSIKEKIPIESELIEPCFAAVIGRMFARCELARESGDKHDLENACTSFWYTVTAMDRMLIGIGTAKHASVALMNHQQQIAHYIKDIYGVNPILDKHPLFDF